MTFPKITEGVIGGLRIAQYRITQFVLGDHLVYN